MVSEQATCLRKAVGAVIVRENRVVATGFNGSLPGAAHCLDVGCQLEAGHCVRTTHSEANAILQAARFGISVDGSTIYVTVNPCRYCLKLIAGCGIRKVVYGEWYGEIFDVSAFGVVMETVNGD